MRQRWKSAGTGCCEHCALPLHRHEWVRLDSKDAGDTALCPLEPVVDDALRGVQALLAYLTHERLAVPAPGTPESDALWASVRLATRDGWARPGEELRRLKALVDAAIAQRRSEGGALERCPVGDDVHRAYTRADRIYADLQGVPIEHSRRLRDYSYLCSFSTRSDEEEARVWRLKEELAAAGIDPGWDVVPRELPKAKRPRTR